MNVFTCNTSIFFLSYELNSKRSNESRQNIFVNFVKFSGNEGSA